MLAMLVRADLVLVKNLLSSDPSGPYTASTGYHGVKTLNGQGSKLTTDDLCNNAA